MVETRLVYCSLAGALFDHPNSVHVYRSELWVCDCHHVINKVTWVFINRDPIYYAPPWKENLTTI